MRSPELLQGEHLKLYIGVNDGRVVLDFGRSLSHIEMEPQEAEQLLTLLRKHADLARQGSMPLMPAGELQDAEERNWLGLKRSIYPGRLKNG